RRAEGVPRNSSFMAVSSRMVDELIVDPASSPGGLSRSSASSSWEPTFTDLPCADEARVLVMRVGEEQTPGSATRAERQLSAEISVRHRRKEPTEDGAFAPSFENGENRVGRLARRRAISD